ncbi:MAG: hypothetical protein N2323_07190 [candidate division WOR-3 bacterium]|nr:hypothetical protein [candidate division WOR-3 bacterium]MCX7837707.1 hypothetical protein [candidate division WOR-3 bacterium]
MPQVRLEKEYSIKTNDVNLNKIPEHLRNKFQEKYLNKRENKIKLGLRASYELLKELADDLGEKFWDDKKMIELLDIRNNTILAHGINPVKKESYDELLEHLLKLGGIKREDLPEFPTLDL